MVTVKVPALAPVCSTCNDTHRMSLGDRIVSCTKCPVPCQECRKWGTSAYCTETPCGCSCHAAPVTDEQIRALMSDRGDQGIPNTGNAVRYGVWSSDYRAQNGATIRDLCITALGMVHPHNVRDARRRVACILNARSGKESK